MSLLINGLQAKIICTVVVDSWELARSTPDLTKLAMGRWVWFCYAYIGTGCGLEANTDASGQ